MVLLSIWKRIGGSVINWLKNKLGITALEKENERLKRSLDWHKEFVRSTMAELKEYSRVDVDVGVRGPHTVILTGVYRGRGYVRFYDVSDSHFKFLVEELHRLKKFALVRNIDYPPQFTGSFDIGMLKDDV